MMEATVSQNSRPLDDVQNHSIKSVPNSVEVIKALLKGDVIHHSDWTKTHGGEQHRLGVTIHTLRHKHKFGDLIQCPKDKEHPKRFHYFIAPSDIPQATEIARQCGLLSEEKQQ
ncbi:hypothetical protein THIOSC15_2640002 [uncultured Thiomicrorhabdus sp.]